MKAWKKLIFIFIAYAITLMHTVVPHQHENSVSGIEVAVLQNPVCSSLVGFLQLFFSADLGSDHLEKFKKSPLAEVALSFVAVLLYTAIALVLLTFFRKISPVFPDFIEKLQQKALLFSSKPLRAPPIPA